MLGLEILILAAVMGIIGYPIFAKRPEGVEVEEGDEYHSMLYSRDAAYMAIKDLEFDYKTGKLDDEDYKKLKEQFEGEAVEILKKLDTFEKKKKRGKKKKR